MKSRPTVFYSALSHQPIMAESSLEPAAAADLLIEQNKEEPSLPAESTFKELIVTMTTERSGPVLASDVGIRFPSSNGATESPGKVLEEEATPTPPESLLSDNGTVTTATTEEESLSVVLRNMKAERGQDREGESGKS